MKNRTGILKISQLMLVTALTLLFDNLLYSQGIIPASPANWVYPDANISATKYVPIKSYPQILDSMVIKWTSDYISGDVQLLIGNIVHNPRIIDDYSVFPYSPNEIVAVTGDNLIILSGAGKLLANYELVDKDRNGIGILGVSALLDTSATYGSPNNSARTLILGFESIESKRHDSLAVAYLGGWNHTSNQFNLLRRLALNLNTDYLPNVSASLKPVYAQKRQADEYETEPGYSIFTAVNMMQPTVPAGSTSDRPFFRGLTKFNLHHADIGYPLPDEGDDYYSRAHVGPQVSFATPSISKIDAQGNSAVLLPCLPTSTGANDIVENTFPNDPYLLNYELTNYGIDEKLSTFIDEGVGTRPRIRPYYVELNDAGLGEGDREYILMTTEYNGIQGSKGSQGRAGLFLYDTDGMPLFDLDTAFDKENYPFFGSMNHYWSVATGNIDGNASNEWLPCYPNNQGKEIVVTQSSHSFAYPGSKLMVLRYNSGFPVQKASPPGEYLRRFDTICTQYVNGWVAAVNDLDGIDGKDEILLVGGTDLMIVRMNDYSSIKFRSGDYFDTVFAYTFANQTITSAAIADIDGDGMNDIVITTNEGMFVLGTPLSRTIDITNLQPDSTGSSNYQINYCFGDTVEVKWNNIIQGNNSVNIYFKKYGNGVPLADSLLVLEQNYPNAQDSVTYRLVVNDTLAGLEGRIIVQSAANPQKNSDTTGYLVFNKPKAWFDTGDLNVIYSGAEVTVKGHVLCADSLALMYSFTADSTAEWITIGHTAVDTIDNSFTLVTDMPCFDFFECNSIKGDTVIFGRVVYSKSSLTDSSDVFPMTIKPAMLPITIEPCESICPSRIVRWDIVDSLTNINLNVLISQDYGKTFEFIETVPFAAGVYEWHVPVNMSDTVLLRLCSEETCLRTDTLIWNYKAKYIKTVAPNPFKIPYEAEIVYSIDEDTEVTMRIVDQANRLVKQLVAGADRIGGYIYCERWDGRLPDRTPASNGMYYIYLELSNGSKEVYPIFIKN